MHWTLHYAFNICCIVNVLPSKIYAFQNLCIQKVCIVNVCIEHYIMHLKCVAFKMFCIVKSCIVDVCIQLKCGENVCGVKSAL